MFTEKRAMFIYSISPVHMGAGTSLGVIDNPIQRERHTDHPVMAGSGIKGAMRHAADGNGIDKGMVNKIFGPEPSKNDDSHAGAVSFSDGQIVLFPVRCLKEGFVYATCPTALARLARLLEAADIGHAIKPTISLKDGSCITTDDAVLSANGKLILEAYEYANDAAGRSDLQIAAKWLSENAVPSNDSFQFFREKISRHMVLLNDGEFAFFVRNATVVEAHVCIDDASGTARDGGLFFTENLPPESLLVSLAMASEERKKKGSEKSEKESAGTIVNKISDAFNEKMLQIGGDATTGRGQVFIRFAGGNGGAA